MRKSLRRLTIVILFGLLGSAIFYLVYTQYSLNLARRFVPIPDSASNLSAFYLGIGQGRMIYVRFDLESGSEDQFLSELCQQRYTDIDNRTNPFRDRPPDWWMPDWWTPPTNPQAYLGGECYDRTGYQILIDKTNQATYTAYITVSL